MISLIGEYDCKADAKGRVMFPSALKKQLASILQEGFVLKKSIFEPCLELYPMQEWNVAMAKVNKKNKFIKKNNDFIRGFTAGAKLVELDGTGRVLLPKSLCTHSGISKEVIMVASVNIIEIWDKDKYHKAVQAVSENFAALAEDVMGKDDDDE
ncbi:division/cell wall cluster transcriptional repressor MraZ [Polaribacter porphyrae]|uniref:Transcriptional regulator MraZ n=1 Tax=Polaribacter porphyrae TaxID=1137780 RepID=A0A2S7WSZ8_9FLAO|nr:division/cell wall cluster transcriptional repressor MraZ [Polaribacter porphyrae]PQJ80719.1 division/cell wall cluster transcriptional repressor MraZ [Polaribacter porphyrae]